MTRRRVLKNKLVIYVLSALLIVMASFSVYTVLDSYFSFSELTENAWDGVSVSSSFSNGNGSLENPYIIKSGADFIYFKNLIEGLNSDTYSDKYYKLAGDIDLGDHTISSIGVSLDGVDKLFNGVFDGDGYTIKNVKISSSVINNKDVYGLFSIINGGSVSNLNLENVDIIPNGSNNPYVVGTIAGVVKENSSIRNISIYDGEIDLTNSSANNNSMIAGLVGNVSTEVEIGNIYLHTTLDSNYSSGVAKVVHTMDSNLSNIVVNVETNSLMGEVVSYFATSNNESNINDLYVAELASNKLNISKDGDNVSEDAISTILDGDSTGDYYWAIDNNVLKLNRVMMQEEELVPGFFAFGNEILVEHSTGVEGDTAYLNDLISDYDNYLGKNYTWEDHSSSMPTGEKVNYYGSHNLVKTFIQYNGTDPGNGETGYVSLIEQVSKFNYYKYYVLENGYINIELIDHPYADRPDNKAFGGWITDYPGAVITYDREVHTYYAKVPVSNVTDTVNIIFRARWIPATTSIITSTNTSGYTTAINGLNTRGFLEIEKEYVATEDISGLYIRKSISINAYYPDQYFNNNLQWVSNGGSRCRSATCYYYDVNGDTQYDVDTTYYARNGNTLSLYQVATTSTFNGWDDTDSAAGLFVQTTVSRGTSSVGYYDANGYLLTSGSCTSNSCTYYKLLQYSDGNINSSANKYYYFVTRDTNILFINMTTSIGNNFWNKMAANKPLTVTGINNGVYVNAAANMNSSTANYSIGLTDDMRIEYVDVYANTSNTEPSSGTGVRIARAIKGNYYNLKLGRGIERRNNAYTAQFILGGSNSSVGSSGDERRYKMIVESGYYAYISIVSGRNRSVNMYVQADAIYGSDFDRAIGSSAITNLEVRKTAAGSYGGYLYSSTYIANTVVKYGSFGTALAEYTDGIYVGGLSSGTHDGIRKITIEGGFVYNLIGGPCVSDDRGDLNDIYMNIKGGSVDFIVGGAGRTETYGNRILNITGGIVNRAAYGGSNGYLGSNGEGVLTGESMVYVGGHATIGSDAAISEGPSDYEEIVGSIYGAGNGRSGNNYTDIGTTESSKVIVEGNAVIKGNVFGGGNYGAVGTQAGFNTNTKIKVLGGEIKGSVYGGGNNNGAGTSGYSCDIYIDMSGGSVGNIYGGSRTKGIVYGSSSVNVFGGTVLDSIYGGGEGGYSSTTNYGTFVSKNVSVTIGREIKGTTPELPLSINGNVYGGSAFGSINGSSDNGSANTSLSTNVNVYYGIIGGSVFGGGKGSSTYTPKVFAPVIVNVYGGNIGNVFGGNDASGQPNSTDHVYLKGGIIGNAFGGGNSTGQDTTNIFLQGATLTNLFGGSNSSGVVTSTNVDVSSGSVGNIYGGNNEGTSTDTTSVNVSGGTILGDIYGGGKKAPVLTKVTLTITAPNVNDVYGGSQEADAKETVVTITGTTGKKVFGGSNTAGTVQNSFVTINGLKYDNVYGGNNAGGVTNNSSVVINNGTITTVYGGGDKAETGTTVVKVNNGVITNIFGGGNEAGVDSSDVDVIGGHITNVFGGSNNLGDVGSTDVSIGGVVEAAPVTGSSVFSSKWGSGTNQTTVAYSVTLNNSSANVINEWLVKLKTSLDVINVATWTYPINFVGGVAEVDNNDLYGNVVNIPANGSTSFDFQVTYNYDYSNPPSDDLFKLDVEVVKPGVVNDSSKFSVSNVYGGNNLGGVTGPTKVVVNSGTINEIYGGGNKARAGSTNVVVKYANVTNIFGGGKLANVAGNTFLDIDDSILNTNVFGGGDEGQVSGSTEVFVTNSTIKGSLYAGGNGTTATVFGNTKVTMDGRNVVGFAGAKAPQEGCVFGGGKAAFTGSSENGNSFATVNIIGGHIYGNVYGGANTSVVYGGTVTNIGKELVNNNFIQDDIIIDGTVFGGGEANADGREEYDFDFFSVVGSINVNIDGSGYVDNNFKFEMNGSIFGSGNASSSSGTSNINIRKLGTVDNISKNMSIQRTNKLVIDNSFMELEGIEDRTNEFSSIKYSFNQIDEFIMKNNTRLYLRKNANLLKNLYSGVDVNGTLVPAKVEINDATKTVTKNVDNRIYMIPFNNLNVTTTQDISSYGKVTGMTFFGMYNFSGDGSFSYGIYNDSYNYGDATGMHDMIAGSSYVLGLHHEAHDITVDGFYTNTFTEDYSEVVTAYIEPSPPSANFYRWMIGVPSINYTVDLTASRYSSLGTLSLSMIDFTGGDTTFKVLGFNSDGLDRNIRLVDSNLVPKIASSITEANSIFGLAMKSETREWTNSGTTKFTDENGGTFYGDTSYKTDSQKDTPPSIMFYLYHAKNITIDDSIGSVLITMESEEPINEIESKFNLVTITVNIVGNDQDFGNNYDASITYDKKYEMPSATSVNITNQSQFTTYFSLFATDELKNIYGTNYQNYHVLTSTYAFPVGTQITMIDFGYDLNNPRYYYYDVTQDEYNDSVNQLNNDGEIAYRLDKFVRMGSTSGNNHYDDEDSNRKYFSTGTAMEEFIFIIDLKKTTTTGEHLNNAILFEIRDTNDAEKVPVLGVRRQYMQFSLYDASNVVLREVMEPESEYLHYDIPLGLSFEAKVGYDTTANGAAIIDTNYESSAMGLNLYVFDSLGNQVSSSALSGTVLNVDGKTNFVDGDGVFRVKLAGKVSNLTKQMSLLSDDLLPEGRYVFRFVLFASADGKHNSSLESSAIVDKNLTVVGSDNALLVTTDDKTKVVDGSTALNKADSKTNRYEVTYRSVLINPNVRVSLYKRDIASRDSIVYEEIDFNTLFTNNLIPSSSRKYIHEKQLSLAVNNINNVDFKLHDKLTSGTYKLVFRLYDGDTLIEEENEYIIVTKEIVKDN